MRPIQYSETRRRFTLGVRGRAALAGFGAFVVLALSVGALTSSRASIPPQPLATAVPASVAAEAAQDETPQDGTAQDGAPQDPSDHKARLAAFMQRVSAFRAIERFLHPGAVHHQSFARSGPPIRPGGTPLECMTQAVYYEARGEPEAGQKAVAQVVLNRSRLPNYPKSICGVVFQGSSRPGCQFSFACEGNRQGGPVNQRAWTQAQSVAQTVLTRQTGGDPSATHYHTPAVAPLWDRAMQKLAQIGHHIFFSSGQVAPQPPAESLGEDHATASGAAS